MRGGGAFERLKERCVENNILLARAIALDCGAWTIGGDLDVVGQRGELAEPVIFGLLYDRLMRGGLVPLQVVAVLHRRVEA